MVAAWQCAKFKGYECFCKTLHVLARSCLRWKGKICQGDTIPSQAWVDLHSDLDSVCRPSFAFVVDSECPLKACLAFVTKRGVTGCCECGGGSASVRCQLDTGPCSAAAGLWCGCVFWRTYTLLLLSVSGALQGILGPEGKPVPRFMWGMLLPRITELIPQDSRVWAFWDPVGKFHRGENLKGVWSNSFCAVTTPSWETESEPFNVLTVSVTHKLKSKQDSHC